MITGLELEKIYDYENGSSCALSFKTILPIN